MALTLVQLRTHVETGLVDGALQLLLDDAALEVTERFGDDTAKVVILAGQGHTFLRLIRPALTITSIYQDTVLVPATDYELRSGGRLLGRLPTSAIWEGDDLHWGRRNIVTYTPIAETLIRDRMTIELVRLAAGYNGLQSEKVGDYASGSLEYHKAREQVLQSGANRRGLRFA